MISYLYARTIEASVIIIVITIYHEGEFVSNYVEFIAAAVSILQMKAKKVIVKNRSMSSADRAAVSYFNYVISDEKIRSNLLEKYKIHECTQDKLCNLSMMLLLDMAFLASNPSVRKYFLDALIEYYKDYLCPPGALSWAIETRDVQLHLLYLRLVSILEESEANRYYKNYENEDNIQSILDEKTAVPAEIVSMIIDFELEKTIPQWYEKLFKNAISTDNLNLIKYLLREELPRAEGARNVVYKALIYAIEQQKLEAIKLLRREISKLRLKRDEFPEHIAYKIYRQNPNKVTLECFLEAHENVVIAKEDIDSLGFIQRKDLQYYIDEYAGQEQRSYILYERDRYFLYVCLYAALERRDPEGFLGDILDKEQQNFYQLVKSQKWFNALDVVADMKQNMQRGNVKQVLIDFAYTCLPANQAVKIKKTLSLAIEKTIRESIALPPMPAVPLVSVRAVADVKGLDVPPEPLPPSYEELASMAAAPADVKNVPLGPLPPSYKELLPIDAAVNGDVKAVSVVSEQINALLQSRMPETILSICHEILENCYRSNKVALLYVALNGLVCLSQVTNRCDREIKSEYEEYLQHKRELMGVLASNKVSRGERLFDQKGGSDIVDDRLIRLEAVLAKLFVKLERGF